MEIKRFVCLANSRKLSGRCIAGKEIVDHQPAGWLRPVSDRPNGEVSERERQYADGSDPQKLDIIRVALLRPIGHDYQPENWVLDPSRYWEKDGEVGWRHLARLADQPHALWINDGSTYHGRHDEVAHTLAPEIGSSLALVHVSELTLRVFAPGGAFGDTKRRVQAAFRFNLVEYRLWVTDPEYEREYLRRDDGQYEVGECYLTISLGEVYAKQDACYKLVAGIMERDRLDG